MKINFRKAVAFILVMLMVSLSINTAFAAAHEVEEMGTTISHSITIGFIHLETSGHCPACPSDDHPSTDHSHFSCDHHNYFSFGQLAAYTHPASIPRSLPILEVFQFIPEVFPSIDTPPHILI